MLDDFWEIGTRECGDSWPPGEVTKQSAFLFQEDQVVNPSFGGLLWRFLSYTFLSKLEQGTYDVLENVTYLFKVLFKLLPQLWTNIRYRPTGKPDWIDEAFLYR